MHSYQYWVYLNYNIINITIWESYMRANRVFYRKNKLNSSILMTMQRILLAAVWMALYKSSKSIPISS
jgi:hypothetical protein